MGKTIHGDARTIILRVLTFFENEKKMFVANKGLAIPIDQAVNRACAATGVSKRTLMKIKNEGKMVAQTVAPEPSTSAAASGSCTIPIPNLPTPGKTRRKKYQKVELDSFDLYALRNIVYNFYIVRKELPTLEKVLVAARRDLNFPGGKSTLREILVNYLGYKFKKCKDATMILMQKPTIAAWRARYLRTKKENHELGVDKRPVTYLGETWIHSHYTVRKCWQNSSDASIKKHDNPGQRWILVHAGGDNGFIPEAELLYKCKSNTCNNHHELDTNNYTNWLKEKILTNLPPNSLIVIDNAPYHSTQLEKPPMSSAPKSDMQSWLRSNNTSFDEKMTKRELYHLIVTTKPPKKFVVDELMREHGHEVLRLPPYHCDLNPIEYIWNLVKQRVADKNIIQSEMEIENLIREAIKSITVSDWQKEINLIERLENEYWEKDRLQEIEERELIISLGGEETNSENENDDDSDAMSGVEETVYRSDDG